MEIESLCPFQAAAVLWEPRAGGRRLTVCAKITLALAHGRTASIAPQQIPPHEDLFWDRNADASLYAPRLPSRPTRPSRPARRRLWQRSEGGSIVYQYGWRTHDGERSIGPVAASIP